jgi:hypothetical protein
VSTVELAGTPAVFDLDVTQGAYFAKLLIWKDELDVPIDNTGYTARMKVRKRIESSVVIVELATAEDVDAEGDITLGGVNGEILLEMSATVTAALPATPFDRRWRYDLEMVPAGGQVRRLLMGRFIVSPEVTR